MGDSPLWFQTLGTFRKLISANFRITRVACNSRITECLQSKRQVSWRVTPCRYTFSKYPVASITVEAGSRFLRKVGIFLPKYKTSSVRRLPYLWPPYWEPQTPFPLPYFLLVTTAALSIIPHWWQSVTILNHCLSRFFPNQTWNTTLRQWRYRRFYPQMASQRQLCPSVRQTNLIWNRRFARTGLCTSLWQAARLFKIS